MATILVAEDDADISVLLRILLEDEGHDGRGGVRRRGSPGRLPVPPGRPRGARHLAARRPRRARRAAGPSGRSEPDPRPRVLLLSARASDDDVQRGLDAGADAYVVKPFDATELIVRVGALVGGSAGA